MKKRVEMKERRLRVRWTTEEWKPEITHVGVEAGVELLGVELPQLKKLPRRKRQILWAGGMVRFNRNNLPGLNGSRTTWR
jgi:hypothetical protein